MNNMDLVACSGENTPPVMQTQSDQIKHINPSNQIVNLSNHII